MSCFPPSDCCPNPCYDPCFSCCNPCWPCRPCPCPPPEKLAIPFSFPDPPKKKGRGRKGKKGKADKQTSTTAIHKANISLGDPCRICKRCTCECPKLIPPCYVGCCAVCPSSGWPCPPPCPPPSCSCTK